MGGTGTFQAVETGYSINFKIMSFIGAWSHFCYCDLGILKVDSDKIWSTCKLSHMLSTYGVY